MGWMWASKSQTPPTVPHPPPQSAQPTSSPRSTSSETTAATTDPEVARFLALFQEDVSSKSTEASPLAPAPPSAPEPASQHQEQHQKEPASSWLSFTFPSKPKSVSNPSDPHSISSFSSSSSSTNTSSHQSSTTSSSPATGRPPIPASTFEDDDDEGVEDPSLPSPAYASLGTDMSCRNAFDYAFHCNSLGGQWNAVYRYGEMQSCSDRWGDFWFCMRTRSMKGKLKEDAIRQYYQEKEAAKYNGQPNSEDVWKPRKHLVKKGAFLRHPLPTAEEPDEEWNLREIQSRKELRDKLGLGPETGTHTWAVSKDS